MSTLRSRLHVSRRRRALIVLLVIALLAVTWMGWIGAAGLSGIQTKDMDWDGDGQVTGMEIAQAYYAVVADKQVDGNRTCTTYRWRGSGKEIRVECRTEVHPAEAEKKE